MSNKNQHTRYTYAYQGTVNGDLGCIDHHNGLEAVGLYLTQPEFEELVKLRKYSFNPTCLDFIFGISSGHTGAINDVVYVISCDDVSLSSSIKYQNLRLHLSHTGKSQPSKNCSPCPIFSSISPLIICTQDFIVPVSFGEVSLMMMHFRYQQWLTFYALLSVRMSSWIRCSC